MKKIMILSAIIATIGSNNAAAMLLIGRIKQTPKRPLITQQHRSTWPPSKKVTTVTPNIFNTPQHSLSEAKMKELLQDHKNRNEKLKILLAAHKESSKLILGDIAEQTSIINYTLSLGQTVPVATLEYIEERLQKNITDHSALGCQIKNEADRLHKVTTTRSNPTDRKEERPLDFANRYEEIEYLTKGAY